MDPKPGSGAIRDLNLSCFATKSPHQRAFFMAGDSQGIEGGLTHLLQGQSHGDHGSEFELHRVFILAGLSDGKCPSLVNSMSVKNAATAGGRRRAS